MTIRLKLPKVIQDQFREHAMKRFGFRKGALSEAGKEAIQMWLATTEEGTEKIENPTEALENLLSMVPEDGVTLQHKARQLFLRED